MKVKKITVEFDNGAVVTFEDEEIEALQKVRGILEFIDTSANIMKLAGFNLPVTHNSPFTFEKPGLLGTGAPIDWDTAEKNAKEKDGKK